MTRTTLLDLGPAAQQMARLLAGISDHQLTGRTPCPDYTLGDLIDHVDGLSLAFTRAATKEAADDPAQGPSGDASRLGVGWGPRTCGRLFKLAEAWRDRSAWQGMTRAGGVDLPGEVAGRVALDELVIHGWDVARASGQPFRCDPAALEACLEFLSAAAAPGEESGRDGIFGPVVQVPPDAPLLDRVIGLSGRDPAWAPA